MPRGGGPRVVAIPQSPAALNSETGVVGTKRVAGTAAAALNSESAQRTTVAVRLRLGGSAIMSRPGSRARRHGRPSFPLCVGSGRLQPRLARVARESLWLASAPKHLVYTYFRSRARWRSRDRWRSRARWQCFLFSNDGVSRSRKNSLCRFINQIGFRRKQDSRNCPARWPQ